MNRCDSTNEMAGIIVQCEREHAHGGAHRATIDDTEIDPDFTYVMSWWPTGSTPPPPEPEVVKPPGTMS